MSIPNRDTLEFRWNQWNLVHAQRHGVHRAESERIVRRARTPYPRRERGDRWLVRGPGIGGRLVQVVYLIDPKKTLYIIHARHLSDIEKHRYRRQQR